MNPKNVWKRRKFIWIILIKWTHRVFQVFRGTGELQFSFVLNRWLKVTQLFVWIQILQLTMPCLLCKKKKKNYIWFNNGNTIWYLCSFNFRNTMNKWFHRILPFLFGSFSWIDIKNQLNNEIYISWCVLVIFIISSFYHKFNQVKFMNIFHLFSTNKNHRKREKEETLSININK